VASIQQIFSVQIALYSLQHEAYNEIYGIGAFYDYYIFTVSLCRVR